ncbi:MAG: carboxypeptidase-like regulatory domain-containing protein, partial [Candidatus Acidiferrales bacterium]
MKRIVWVICAVVLSMGAASSEAAGLVVLTGHVTSRAEGAMEGVLVSARRVGGIVTVTVVSDRAGHYTFTGGELAPGEYSLNIRATGYEMASPNPDVKVGKSKTKVDIRLQTTKNLADQLTSAEWLMSMPGTQDQKEMIYENCVLCHSLTPVMKSTYDADAWKTTFHRMWNWASVSAINKPVPSPVPQGAWRFGVKESADLNATDEE